MRPELIHFGPVTIYSYTVCMIAGVLVVGALGWREAKRRGRLTEQTLMAASYGLAGGVIGAKLSMIVFLGWSDFWKLSSSIPQHGAAFAGALTGGWFAVGLAERLLRMERCTGDLVAPFLPLGQAIGRVGNLLAGDAYGLPTSLPWGISQAGASRHPVQIIELVLDLVLFAFLYRRRLVSFRDGELFKIYLLGYAAIRFPIEFLRFQPTTPSALGLTLVQWLCLLSAAWAGFGLYQSRRMAAGATAVSASVLARYRSSGATAGTGGSDGE